MKNIKNTYSITYALMILSVVAAGISLALMPGRVPVHYDISGKVDRVGSKYEYLIIPAITLLIGTICIVLSKRLGRRGDPRDGGVIVSAGNIGLVFLNILNLFILWGAVSSSLKGGHEIQFDVIKLSCLFLGAALMALCGIMPKAPLNSIFGLRTKWSMANDRVWRGSQRFAGITGVGCGLLIILCGMFFRELIAACIMMGLLSAWTVACVIASYRIYKKDA